MIERLFQIYLEQFKWDIGVFSNPWMYIPLLIPMTFFIPFFLMKWTFLTAPIWLPIAVIIRAVRNK